MERREEEWNSVVSDSLQPRGLYSSWNSPGQNTGVGSCSFSRGSSQPRDQTQVSHIAQFFTSWATKETQSISFWPIWGSNPLQFSSVTQSSPTLWDPINRSTPGLPVHPQFPEFTQTHVHWVGDAIQLSYTLLTPSPPAPNPSQHQSLFQWVNSSHQVAKVLEFQL